MEFESFNPLLWVALFNALATSIVAFLLIAAEFNSKKTLANDHGNQSNVK